MRAVRGVASMRGIFSCVLWLGVVAQLSQAVLLEYVQRVGGVTLDLDPETVPSFTWQGLQPNCSTDSLQFFVDGVRHHNVSNITDTINALPERKLVHVRVLGECGPFAGPSTSFYLRAGSSDVAVWMYIFLWKELSNVDLVLKETPVRTIVDLGANCGLSLTYWRTHFPYAKIIGVEPELNNYAMAVLNADRHPSVVVERAAVSDQLGWGTLTSLSLGDWAYGSKESQQVHSATESFPVLTIPHLMQKHGLTHIDLLKVDIEGGELQLCQDIARGAHWIKHVRCVTFEFHDRFFPNLPTTILRTCVTALTRAGMHFIGRFEVDAVFMWCR